MEFIAFMIAYLLIFLCAFLILAGRIKDGKRYCENYPPMDCYAEKLLYMTELHKEEVIDRMSRHNVKDVMEYEFREKETAGVYDLKFKNIQKDYEYKAGMVRYDMHIEDKQGSTLLVLVLTERSSPGAQVRFSWHMHEFMMQKLEAGYGYIPVKKEEAPEAGGNQIPSGRQRDI